MKLIEGGDQHDQAVIDELHRIVTKRGLKVRAVDGKGKHVPFMAPHAIGIQFVGPFYRYQVEGLVKLAAATVGAPIDDGLTERVTAEILAKARAHAMKGELE